MEFLVTMTTTVPHGTSQDAIDEIRVREAARARELAVQGSLLRLFRPPLKPGEWRTLGLFAAEDGVELEKVLASMPLRVWRSDEVTPLALHPNDPPPATRVGSVTSGDAQPMKEFFTTFHVRFPQSLPEETIADAMAREAVRVRELAGQGHLERLWKLPVDPSEPDVPRALGLWRARDAAEMQTILESLPMDPWMTVLTTPLSEHPSDPAIVGGP